MFRGGVRTGDCVVYVQVTVFRSDARTGDCLHRLFCTLVVHYLKVYCTCVTVAIRFMNSKNRLEYDRIRSCSVDYACVVRSALSRDRYLVHSIPVYCPCPQYCLPGLPLEIS